MKKYIALIIVFAISVFTHYANFSPWISSIGILICSSFLFKNRNWLTAKNKADRFVIQLSVVLFLLANLFFIFEDTAFIAGKIITPILGYVSFIWLLFAGFFRKKLGANIEPEETAWEIYLSFLLCSVFTYLVQ